jgi:hypothetical protein
VTTPDAPYVSTGRLPPAERVGALVADAHERFRANTTGRSRPSTRRSRDDAGNSVKGQLAARFLSEQLGLDLFVSKPTA